MRAPLARHRAQARGRNDPGGAPRGRAGRGQAPVMALVSGTGAAGTSCVPLSGGKKLGPDGAGRLADALREARAGLLTELDLRCRHVPCARACNETHTAHTLSCTTHKESMAQVMEI